jgi:hypothetical protein
MIWRSKTGTGERERERERVSAAVPGVPRLVKVKNCKLLITCLRKKMNIYNIKYIVLEL